MVKDERNASLVSQRLSTLADNIQGRGSTWHHSLKFNISLYNVHICCPPQKRVGLSSLFTRLWSFSVSFPLQRKTGAMDFVKNQSENSDDYSSDGWTVKHYLWFRGFFLKVQLRGSAQTSTTAPTPLPRRRFKWQANAYVRWGCFATNPRQKNKNDIISKMLWFVGADELEFLCCCVFLRSWSARRYEIRMEDSLQRSSKAPWMHN